MLTKQPPFPGTDSLTVLDRICNERLKSVRSLDPRVPRALELICHKAMEKDPALRYGTAAELAEDLESFLSGRRIRAQAPSLVRRSKVLVSSHPSLAVASSFLILLIGFGSLLKRNQYALAAQIPAVRSMDAPNTVLKAGIPADVFDRMTPEEQLAQYKEYNAFLLHKFDHKPIPNPPSIPDGSDRK
jgi:serine/threonine protein kinase